jgi:hypothetical protein
MFDNLAWSAYLVLFGILMALIEIEIEGPNGWAVELPTWRRFNWISRFVFGGRPATGYHVFMNLFLVLTFHSPLFHDLMNWEWGDEVKAWASFTIMAGLFWDWWWFILNPDYTWRGHRKSRVPWHPRWIGEYVNADHVVAFVGATAIAIIGYFTAEPELLTKWYPTQIVVLLVATGMLVAVAPMYHRWRKAMGNGGPRYPKGR